MGRKQEKLRLPKPPDARQKLRRSSRSRKLKRKPNAAKNRRTLRNPRRRMTMMKLRRLKLRNGGEKKLLNASSVLKQSRLHAKKHMKKNKRDLQQKPRLLEEPKKTESELRLLQMSNSKRQ